MSDIEVREQKIAKATGFTSEEVAIIKGTVAKNTTDMELAFFLNVCKSVDLNPFNKEIFCFKNSQGDLIVMSGRDGFLGKAQKSNTWNGLTSFVVHKNDEFEMLINEEKVSIKHSPNFTDPGEIIGAYAISKPRGCDYPTIEYVSFKTYNKGWNTWKSHPEAMIQKVAEAHCLKKAYGINGVQSEYDWDIKNGIAVPIEQVESDLDIYKRKIIDALDNYKGEDKEEVRLTCMNRVNDGTFDIQFAQETAAILGIEL